MSYDPNARRDTPLALKLKERIRQQGPIAVSEFMSMCLWDDASGYYATRSGIGGDGDFITAAEISQVFGEIIGLWAGVVWSQVLGSPGRVSLVEYGPGRGTMMRDALRASRVIPGFTEATNLHLVEMSPTLAEAQRQALKDTTVPRTWGKNLAGFPAPAIIIANEFLDAWPTEQWIKTNVGWHLRAVGLDPYGQLCYCTTDNSPPHPFLDQRYPGLPVGTIIESQRLERLAEAFKALNRSGPLVALIIDYGYATPSAGDTLQAVRDHAYENPLTSPGEADVSTHVGFFELATALHHAGLEIDGPVAQTEFLGRLGAIERASRLMHANPARAAEIEAGIARLMAPNGMGTLFKVIGVRSPGLPPLPGFPVQPPNPPT